MLKQMLTVAFYALQNNLCKKKKIGLRLKQIIASRTNRIQHFMRKTTQSFRHWKEFGVKLNFWVYCKPTFEKFYLSSVSYHKILEVPCVVLLHIQESIPWNIYASDIIYNSCMGLP